MIKPILPKECLPSDCRFREDSIAFATDDMVWTQKVKERLEDLQRHDRTLRQENERLRSKSRA